MRPGRVTLTAVATNTPKSRLNGAAIWQAALWAAVAGSLLLLRDPAAFVLFEPGQPGHILLVSGFLLTSVPVFFEVPRRRGLLGLHLSIVGVVFLAHPFAPIFERDGLLVLLAAYFLTVLYRQTSVSAEAKLAWVATLVSIAILEGALSAATPGPPDWTTLADYEDVLGTMKAGGVLQPGLDIEMVEETGPVRFVTNDLGFRNTRPIAPGKPPTELRVILLGDSFIAGYRVDQEETVGQQLERSLAARTSRQVSVWVAVAGGPDEYADYLAQYAFRFDPDVVVIGITLGNDLAASYATSLDLPLVKGPVALTELPPEAYRSAASLVLLRAHRSLLAWRWYRRAFAAVRPAGITSWHLDAPTEVHFFDPGHGLGLYYARDEAGLIDDTFAAVGNDLRKVAESCREHERPCIAALIPQRFQVDPREWAAVAFDYGLASEAFDLGLPNRRVTEVCSDVGLTCVDLLPSLREAGGRLYMPRGDMHWTAPGHRVAAEALAAAVLDAVGQR